MKYVVAAAKRGHQRVVTDGRPPKRELGEKRHQGRRQERRRGAACKLPPCQIHEGHGAEHEKHRDQPRQPQGPIPRQVPTGVVEESRRKRDHQFAERVVPHQTWRGFGSLGHGCDDRVIEGR